MKYIYVLEDDAKLNAQILEALRKSEPDSEIRYFTSMEEFQKWVVMAVKLGPASLVKGGHRIKEDTKPEVLDPQAEDQLLLLISKEEWLGSRHMALVRKTQEMLIRKNLCTKEDPTRLVITAFENPDFEIALVEDRIICNVLFKPFDELILSQHLHFALKGHHPASETFVHVVQVEQEVEMTKDVQMEAVGDVGFVTRSPRPIQVGKVSKYYGEVFKGRGRIHVMARCLASQPHPEFTEEFQVWFSYFGIPSHQITDIRKSMILRNEVEYTKALLERPSPFQKKWLILDGNAERVQKWKDILHKLFKVEVETETSLEEFIFKSDPLAADAGQKEKAWVETPTLKLHIDIKTRMIVGVEPETQKSKKIFGLPWVELTKKKIDDYLHPQSLALWKTHSAQASKKHETVLFKAGANRFLLKVQVGPEKTDAPHRTLEFIEAGTQEKTVWYNQHFDNPTKSFCIVVGASFATQGHQAFWKEWLEKLKTQPHTPKVVILFDKVPDEKLSRELVWADDVFEDSNEAPYIERKLKFLYFGEGTESLPVPFLNSCKEMIRVANPVEVAELSEAGIVINYYRPISLGAFRHFVLPKQGAESYSIYRTNCNFSAPHPSEKDLHQNHFVFFGITDAYLKQIRVWILDNYVQSKQKEG